MAASAAVICCCKCRKSLPSGRGYTERMVIPVLMMANPAPPGWWQSNKRKMNTQLKVVRNDTPGGNPFAVYLPDAMASSEWEKWLENEGNRKKLKEAKRFLKKNPDEQEFVVCILPDRREQRIRAQKISDFGPEKNALFVKKTETLIQKGLSTILFGENDTAWDDGFLEFLIDRFKYTIIHGDILVLLEEPKVEGGLYA